MRVSEGSRSIELRVSRDGSAIKSRKEVEAAKRRAKEDEDALVWGNAWKMLGAQSSQLYLLGAPALRKQAVDIGMDKVSVCVSECVKGRVRVSACETVCVCVRERE